MGFGGKVDQDALAVGFLDYRTSIHRIGRKGEHDLLNRHNCIETVAIKWEGAKGLSRAIHYFGDSAGHLRGRQVLDRNHSGCTINHVAGALGRFNFQRLAEVGRVGAQALNLTIGNNRRLGSIGLVLHFPSDIRVQPEVTGFEPDQWHATASACLDPLKAKKRIVTARQSCNSRLCHPDRHPILCGAEEIANAGPHGAKDTRRRGMELVGIFIVYDGHGRALVSLLLCGMLQRAWGHAGGPGCIDLLRAFLLASVGCGIVPGRLDNSFDVANVEGSTSSFENIECHRNAPFGYSARKEAPEFVSWFDHDVGAPKATCLPLHDEDAGPSNAYFSGISYLLTATCCAHSMEFVPVIASRKSLNFSLFDGMTERTYRRLVWALHEWS